MRPAPAESRLLAAVAALAAVLAILLAPATAAADVGETIILRCTHGESLDGFSQSAYRKALKELTADAEEYSDCGSLIHQAQIASAGSKGSGGGSSSGGGGISPLAASAAERDSIAGAANAGSGAVKLDGGDVRPGVVHANVSSAFSTLPTPVLVTLAFVLAGALALAGRALAGRVRANGSA
jgi:hypothetical protein